MFFILSKILNYFIQPLVIVGILLVLHLLLKKPRWKKMSFIGALVVFFFFTNGFIANELMKAWEVPPTPYQEITKQYEWGILLTGIVDSQQEPKDRVYFHKGADRVTHTAQLYQLGIIDKVLVSGGSGRLLQEEDPEAALIPSALMMMGVAEEDIVIEPNSRNTHESAVEVKRLLEKEYTPDECLLITSAFHIRRSRATFIGAGWPSATFSTDFYTHPTEFTPDVLLVPSSGALEIWNHLLKEWVGCVAYWAAGYF